MSTRSQLRTTAEPPTDVLTSTAGTGVTLTVPLGPPDAAGQQDALQLALTAADARTLARHLLHAAEEAESTAPAAPVKVPKVAQPGWYR